MVLRKWPGLLALSLLFLTACSSVKEELRPAKLESIEPRVKLVKVWSRNTGSGQDARYARLQPAVLDGVIYTVDVKGRVSAMDALTGKPIWTTKLQTAIGGGIGVGGGRAFVGTLAGEVIALDLAGGAEVWRAAASSEVVTIPQSNGDVVIAPAIDGRVFAFDHSDGSVRWSYNHPAPILSLRSTAPPLVTESNAFVAFDNGQLLNFNPANGQLRWNARVGQPQGKTELERLVDVDAAPVASGPYIYAAGFNTRLVAVSRGSGRISWSQPVSTAQNIAVQDEKVVVSDADSHIRAFDALTGALLWENEKLHRRAVSAPGIIGSVVVVVDFEGYMHALSLEDGSFVARRKPLNDRMLAPPVTAGDFIYLYSLDGVLSAHSLKPLK